MNTVILWCEECNNAPADGVLTVIDKETQEQEYLNVCLTCVNNLDDSDWLENAV